MPSGPCSSGRCAYTGALRAQRLEDQHLLGRVGEWSSPRTTWVMPMSRSSTADGEVVERRCRPRGRSRGRPWSACWNADSPRITSWTTVSPSSGTRSRTAPSPSSSPRKPRSAVLAFQASTLGGRRSSGRRGPRRAAAARPRRGARRARTGRPAPRPSRARASAARRRSARRSPAWSARGRCPRCAARSFAAGPAREQPVVQCRPRAADVQRARRRGSESDSHLDTVP